MNKSYLSRKEHAILIISGNASLEAERKDNGSSILPDLLSNTYYTFFFISKEENASKLLFINNQWICIIYKHQLI